MSKKYLGIHLKQHGSGIQKARSGPDLSFRAKCAHTSLPYDIARDSNQSCVELNIDVYGAKYFTELDVPQSGTKYDRRPVQHIKK